MSNADPAQVRRKTASISHRAIFGGYDALDPYLGDGGAANQQGLPRDSGGDGVDG
jgi:hypothetical protein